MTLTKSSKILRISLHVILFGFCSCNSDNQGTYDKGYEAAWNGESASTSRWVSEQEKLGYEEGLDDASMYDEGYDDGHDGKRPKYAKDPFYMDGYKDGKKDK